MNFWHTRLIYTHIHICHTRGAVSLVGLNYVSALVGLNSVSVQEEALGLVVGTMYPHLPVHLQEVLRLSLASC